MRIAKTSLPNVGHNTVFDRRNELTWEQLAILAARGLINIYPGRFASTATSERRIPVKLSTNDGSEPERVVEVVVDMRYRVEGMR